MSTTVNPSNEIAVRSPEIFNYQNCWYPITFIQDFCTDKPYSCSLYDEPLVIFRDANGKLVCLRDLCPHRAAKLSDGQLIDGNIECLYHGWQFSSDGECTHIPQLQASAKISKQACVKSYRVSESQGIIWVWLGDSEKASENLIPHIPELEPDVLEKFGLFVVDTVVDLPYGQDFLIENFLDPAHVPISHDRTELGIKREFAAPLEMEIISASSQGFTGRYRRIGSNKPWANTKFTAPNLVQYELGNQSTKIFGGFALYAIPLSKNQCRVLVRRYGNFFSRWFKLKPRWFEHLRQNKLLEEDLPFIVGQQAYIEQSGQKIKDIYLPLKSCDTFVIEHRKWLDKFGRDLPYYQGYTTSKSDSHPQAQKPPIDRFTRHTKQCSACYGAYQKIILFQQVLIAVSVFFAGLGIIAESQTMRIVFVMIAFFGVLKFAILKNLQYRLENNYKQFNLH